MNAGFTICCIKIRTIYDKAGTKRADVAVNDSSTQSKEVQGDNVLSLSFSYYAFLPLDVNDYTDYLGERYWLTERYTPKQVSDGEWVSLVNLSTADLVN